MKPADAFPLSLIDLACKLELLCEETASEIRQNHPSDSAAWSHALVERGYLSADVCSALDSLAEMLRNSNTLGGHSDETQVLPPSPGHRQSSKPLPSTLRFAVDETLELNSDHRPLDETMATPAAASQPTPSPAGRIAPLRYHALSLHAEGGLGRVMLALDTELQREVALKEIKPTFADDELARARFVIEAEVTGKLEHPGIVPVYGLGKYLDGRPYYAMRFVRGRTLSDDIRRYHKRHGTQQRTFDAVVAFRQLLRKFVDVCNAIEYAHSRGVIHRDLKPANVMLGDYGETLVVDWGLAKTRGESSSAQDLAPVSLTAGESGVTLQGDILGTPAFMPPEQARGDTENIGPATDVFSLGATLYTLLTDKAPHTDKDSYAIIKKVIAGNFPLPHEVNPRVSRPLEAICLKAMALRPEDRYVSARQLAEDIEAWLADAPVRAYREPVIERLARWIRRHRTWVTSGVVALAIVAAVAVAAALLINDARQGTAEQRDIAVYQRAEALSRFRDARDAVDTWLTGMSDALKDYPGMQETRVRLLEKAAANYEQFVAHQSDNPEIELERGRALVRLGDVQRMLGKTAQAESSYVQARTLLESLAARLPGPAATAEAANSRVRLALLLAERGDAKSAQAELDQAEHELGALPSAEQNDVLAIDALGSLALNRGAILLDLGERERACKSLLVSANCWKTLLAEKRGTQRQQRYAALTQVLLAQAEQESGRHASAIERLTKAREVYDRMIAVDAGQLDVIDARASTAINLGLSWKQQGQVTKEAECYRQALEDYRKLFSVLPDVHRFQENLALTQNDLAISLIELEQLTAARAALEEALPEFTILRSRFPDVPRYQEQEATASALLGHLQSLEGETESALEHLRAAAKSMAQLIKTFPDVPAYRHRDAIWRSYLAQALAHDNDRNAARTEFESAIKQLRLLAQQDPLAMAYPVDLAHLLALRGGLEWDDAQSGAAETYYAEAKTIYESQMTNHPAPATVNDFARLLIECPIEEIRDPRLAKQLLTPVVAVAQDNAAFRVTYGGALLLTRQLDEAESELKTVRELTTQMHARDGFWSALLQSRRGHEERARVTFDEAESWRVKELPGSAELARLKRIIEKQMDFQLE